MDRPTLTELAIAVRVLDWLAAIVEEEDRGDLAESLRVSRAVAEATRQASGGV